MNTQYIDLSYEGYVKHKFALSSGADLTHPNELKERCPICAENLTMANALVSKEDLNDNTRMMVIRNILKKQADAINKARAMR